MMIMLRIILTIFCVLGLHYSVNAEVVNFVCEGYDSTDFQGREIMLSGSLYPKAIAGSESTFMAPGICRISFRSSGVKEGEITGGYANFQAGDVMEITPEAGVTITGVEMLVTTMTYAQSVCQLIVDDSEETTLPRVYDRPYLRSWEGTATLKLQLSPEALIRFNYISVKYQGEGASISDVSGDLLSDNAEYYSLQGVRLDVAPEVSGIYVLRQGNSVRKIIVRD